MEDYERMRRKVLVEGKSLREVSKELGHSRKTVSKALKYSEPPGYRRTKPLVRPVIDTVKQIIDEWLEEDKKRPRKQRHTGQRIFERLREGYDFKGSSSAIRRYVAYKKATSGEVYFPLQFDAGEEAQVDWGEAFCIMNGESRKVHLYCARLPYSTASFVRAYEREKTEFFLDGHVWEFKYFGGVARRRAYDNLSTAVITVNKGQDRGLTNKFITFRSHYLFETRFCNVASGNEKGHVENLVKKAQREFMTPLPEVSDLEELNAYLLAKCEKDLDREVRGKGKTRRELLEEEREHFLPLPADCFEACCRVSTFATKQSLVRFDTNDYSVPVSKAYHPLVVKGFVDRVEVFWGDELVALHKRSFGFGEFILDPFHYIPLLESKPGGLHNGRPFKGEPWGEDFVRMRKELEFRYGSEGTKKFIKVLLLFTEFPVEDVKHAVYTCLKRRAFSDEAVRGVLSYEPRPKFEKLNLSGRPDLERIEAGIPPAAVYDALIGAEVLL